MTSFRSIIYASSIGSILGSYGLQQSFTRLVIRNGSGYSSSSSSSTTRNIYRIRRFLGSLSSNNFEINSLHQEDDNVLTKKSPWNNTLAVMKTNDIITSRKDSSQQYQQQQQQQKMKTKFRQHVNPLKVQFQLPCDLPPTWPRAAYTTCLSKPLFVDIGCGKGGFLLKLAAATEETNKDNVLWWNHCNFLGIEIRPSVVEYAQLRCSKQHPSGRISFVGCNVNVDLDRLLHLYMLEAVGQQPNPHYETAIVTNITHDDDPSRILTSSLASSSTTTTTTTRIQPIVGFVSIQFPDPHFKARHKKRKVVDESLVVTLAKYTTLQEAQIFLQSDIQEVVDDMRQSFLEYGSQYFDDITTKTTITTTTGNGWNARDSLQ